MLWRGVGWSTGNESEPLAEPRREYELGLIESARSSSSRAELIVVYRRLASEGDSAAHSEKRRRVLKSPRWMGAEKGRAKARRVCLEMLHTETGRQPPL